MPTPFVQPLEAWPKEFLCLLSYSSDGTILWSSSIGNVGDDVKRQMVHMARASASISSAFVKVMNDTTPSNDPTPEQERHETTRRNAILVNCENNTVILTKQVHDRTNTWFAILGRPLALRDEKISYEMLSTLEVLASTLFSSADGDQVNLCKLCETISNLIISNPLWTDWGRTTLFVESLSQFSDAQIRRREEHALKKSGNPDSDSGTELETAIKQSLESFYRESHKYYGASQVRLCVLDADMNSLYAENLCQYEIDCLGWFFTACLNLGMRTLRNNFFDWDTPRYFRMWCKGHSRILFANFICAKEHNGDPPRALREATNAILQAASHSNP